MKTIQSNRFHAVFGALIAALLLLGQTNRAWADGSAAGVAARVDAALAKPALNHASVAVLVRSLADGRVVYEKNADLALMPASNQKILTSTAALSRLGPDFRFKTQVLRTGKIENGVLKGDLFLRGGGDPSLTTARVRELAAAVRAAGIERVDGRILADDSYFDAQRLGIGWQWDDEPFSYQPQVSALNCDENVVTFEIRPGKKDGDPAELVWDKTAYLLPIVSVTTVAATDKAVPRIDADRTRGRNELILRGTIPLGAKPASVTLTFEDPALYAATRFAEALSATRIGRGKTPSDAVLVAEQRSEPLSTLVVHFLKTSDNLYGEVLLKTLGAERGGAGSGAGGAGETVALEFLKSVGVDTTALSINDGSGLSRMDLVTARNLVTVLSAMARNAPAPVRDAFTSALPVGGVDGTLRSRFKNTPAQGVVRAKTGSLSGVSSLSGYVTTKAGEPLVFSILMNNVLAGSSAARGAQDELVLALMDLPKGSTPP